VRRRSVRLLRGKRARLISFELSFAFLLPLSLSLCVCVCIYIYMTCSRSLFFFFLFFVFSVNQVSGCEQNFTTHIFALRSAVHQTTPSTGSFLPLSLSQEGERVGGDSAFRPERAVLAHSRLFLRETSRRVRVLRRTITVKAFYSGLPFTAVDVRVRACRFIITFEGRRRRCVCASACGGERRDERDIFF